MTRARKRAQRLPRVAVDCAVRRKRFHEAWPLRRDCGHEHDTAPPGTSSQAGRLGQLTASFRTTASALLAAIDAISGTGMEDEKVLPSLSRWPFQFNGGVRLRGVTDARAGATARPEPPVPRGCMPLPARGHKHKLTACPLRGAGRCDAIGFRADAGDGQSSTAHGLTSPFNGALLLGASVATVCYAPCWPCATCLQLPAMLLDWYVQL